MSKAAIYARYSSHNQDGGTSIEVQLEQCRPMAGPGAVEYIDRAVTGTTMNRPSFNRMMTDAAAGLFTTLFVHKFDRFGRDAEAHRFVKILEACGVRVVSVTEGHDPLVRGIQLVVAEDFSRKLSERCRLGKIKSFEQGVWQSGVIPFGYHRDGVGLAIDAHESEAVRFAFDTYGRNNVSLMQVANKLMDQGYRPRKAPYWSAGTMRAFLTLPLYRGIRRHREVEVYDASLQIVQVDLWQQVHNMIVSRKSRNMVGRRTQAFTRLLYCAECGSIYSRTSSTYNGKQYPYKWTCEQRLSRGAAICPNRTFLRESDLREAVARNFDRVFQESERIIAKATALARQQLATTVKATDDLRGKLRSADTQIDRLVGLLTSNQIPDQDAVKALSERIGASKRERDRLVDEIAKAPSETASIDRIEAEVRRIFGVLCEGLAGADGAILNAALHETIGPMSVSRDGQVIPLAGATLAGAKVALPSGAGQIIGSLFWSRWAA